MQLLADSKRINLRTAFAADLPLIEGDGDRLQQVFGNLLSNAIKFTPSEGLIEARMTGSGFGIEIQIRDSGQGIKPEFLPHVFERFRQADSF